MILRLAWVDLRSLRLQTLLTLLVVTVTAATLALAIEVRRAADEPWQRTFDATNGAHLWAVSDSYGADLSGFAHAPGVVGATSIDFVNTSFVLHGTRYGLALVATKDPHPSVSKLLVVSGSGVTDGGVVLERSMARALGVHVGEWLRVATTTGTRPLRVVGIAITSSSPGYPQRQPGLGWTTSATLATVQPDARKLLSAIGLRLKDPDGIDAFMRSARGAFSGGMHVEGYRSIRESAGHATRNNQKVLSTQAVFLLLAAGFILATLVATRVVAQARRIGLLKAVGLTPGQVVRLYLAQYLAIGLVGALGGIALSRLLVPYFLRTSGEVLSASSPGFSVGRTLFVIAVVEAIVAAFAFVPAWRGARRPTIDALASGLGPARASRSRVSRVAGRLHFPLPAVVGLKDAFARPGRALLTAFSLALTVAVVVAVLQVEQNWRDQQQRDNAVPTQSAFSPPLLSTVGPTFTGDPNYDSVAAERKQLRPLIYASIGILGAVGLLNLLATAILSVRERRREFAILRTIGMTPRDVRASVLWSNALLGLVAAVLGIPLGLLTYRLVGDATAVPWLSLALVVPGAILASLVATLAPARRAEAALTVSRALQGE